MPILVDPAAGSPAGARTSVVTALLNGILFGTRDEYDVDLNLYKLDGWWEPPTSTGDESERAGADGAWLSQSFAGSRHIELAVEVTGPGFSAVTDALARVSAAMPLRGLDTLVVSEGSISLQADVRQDGRILVQRGGSNGPRWADISIPLIAPDPLRYAVTEQAASTGLLQTTGGTTAPLSLPFSIAATVASGRLAVLNEGNAATPTRFELSGPVPAGSRLTLVSTGASLFIPGEVPAGRTLVVDAASQTALMDGTAPRLVTGVWFRCPPGESEVAFTAPSYSAGALLTGRWRSAWL